MRAPGFTAGGLDQEGVTSGRTPLHQPLNLLLPALTHPLSSSFMLIICFLQIPLVTHSLLPLSASSLEAPASSLPSAGRKFPQPLLAGCSTLTQGKVNVYLVLWYVYHCCAQGWQGTLPAAGVNASEKHIPRVGLTRLGKELSSDLEQESGSQHSWAASSPLAMTQSCHQK